MAYLQYRVRSSNVYKITFTDVKSAVLSHSVLANKNSTIYAPIILTNPSGFELDGWYNGSTKFDFSTPITSDLTLTAKWKTATMYTINYSTARGTAPSSKSVASGYPLTSSDLPSLTADNYTFNGWYLDSSYGTQATAGYAITANTTLYAKWTESGGETTYILDYSVDKTMSSSMGTDGAFSYVGNVTYDSSLGYKFGSNMSQTNNYLAINVNGTITISVEQYSNNTAAGIRIMKEDGTVLYSGTPTAAKTHETLSNISLGTYSGKLLIGRYGGSTVSTRKITITVSN